MKRFRTLLGLIVIIAGLGLFFYPEISTWLLNQQTRQTVEAFEEQFDPQNTQTAGQIDGTDKNGESGDSEVESADFDGLDSKKTEGGNESEIVDPELLLEAISYNTRIYEDGQAEFTSSWIAAQSPEVLSGLKNGLFGYIEIPKISVTLPLYLGASTEHMAKGFAVLGGTSIPVGGINTNSVIAGHRGYRGAPYLREVEKLEIGDHVYITNPWTTLSYAVESILIIDPNDVDAVKIQEGKDMITLLTCHPYRSHGKYRYLVFCVRDLEDEAARQGLTGSEQINSTEDKNTENNSMKSEEERNLTVTDGSEFVSSEPDIRMEQIIRYAGAGLIMLMLVFTLFGSTRKNAGNTKRKRRP